MNYGELKTSLKALAFEEEETITEYEENDVIPNAINLAIAKIADEVMPITKTYEISQDGDDDEYMLYDFTTLVDDFLEFVKHPIRIDEGDVYKNFGDYKVEDDTTLVIAGNVQGTFKVFYSAAHTPYVAGGEMDDIELPLKRKVHTLVPLLAAFFVWNDDDSTKAAQYMNLYLEAKQNILDKKSTPKMRFLEGGI